MRLGAFILYRTYAVVPATLHCLPFDKLRKFGSKLLHLFFIEDFCPAGQKSSIIRKKRYHGS
jgi:hypothetical protein